jgi:UDPglucose--hexose-1-phosphate uridylyltransferase
MPGGLFELRRDDITGWWVATVVDREFERARFARPARRLPTPDGECQNCRSAPVERAWLRILKPQAFTLGSDRPVAVPSARGREVSGGSGVAGGTDASVQELAMGLLGDVGSWETIVAPFGHHAALSEESERTVIEMLALARERIRQAQAQHGTAYLQVVQNWGEQAGAMTNHLCFDVYDLPDIPHRIGEELGGAARYVIREGVCPWCRLVETEVARRDRLVFDDAASVCFAPYASRSPFELWIVPRHHEPDFARATDEQLTSAAETLRKVIRMLGSLDGPAYNLVLHTAPLHENVRETYHWHWEIHPRLREIGGLELGTGLPVNPISPEEAVDELLAATRAAAGEPTGRDEPDRGRSWDEFSRR